MCILCGGYCSESSGAVANHHHHHDHHHDHHPLQQQQQRFRLATNDTSASKSRVMTAQRYLAAVKLGCGG